MEREKRAKAWIVIVENHEITDTDGIHKMTHYARADCLTGGQNIARIWPENVDTALLVNTKKEAEETAETWNKGYKERGIFTYDSSNRWHAEGKTGIYIEGRELTREELRDYIDTLRARLDRRNARGLANTETSKAIREHINEYEEILKEEKEK